jgi:hypothetical protein
MSGLFRDEAATLTTPETLSKKAFAAHLGVTQARVSQLIEAGLPVRPNGRIAVEDGVSWYTANVDPNRAKGSPPDPARGRTVPPDSPRAEMERIKADRERIKLERELGAVIDRKAAEKAIFERARAERDSWLSFVSRAAPDLAAELDAEPARCFAVLDRLIREHLRELSQRPLEELARDPSR